jgi:hypothetical protein
MGQEHTGIQRQVVGAGIRQSISSPANPESFETESGAAFCATEVLSASGSEIHVACCCVLAAARGRPRFDSSVRTLVVGILIDGGALLLTFLCFALQRNCHIATLLWQCTI